jgi:hypothetical protein
MDKLLTWVKRHKIISIVIVLVILIIGAASGSNKPKTPTTPVSVKTTPTSSATPKKSTQPTAPKLSYKVIETKGTSIVSILVPTSYDNTDTMKQLGQTLKSDYGSSKYPQLTVYVFDDQNAASLLDTVLSGNDTATQDAQYDPHFVAEYQTNVSTGLNRFTIQTNGGVNDPNPTTINY